MSAEANRQLAEPPPAPVEPVPLLPTDATETVDRILSSTESAVAAIVRRTEQEVRGMAAEFDARMTRDALERTARLTQLRRELTDQASALAVHFEEILNQLEAVEAALGMRAGGGSTGHAPPDSRDPQVAAIKMTLRERQRISLAYDLPGQPPVEAAAPPSPGEAPVVAYPRRRWWQVWSREAA